jgi:hypothetical protein
MFDPRTEELIATNHRLLEEAARIRAESLERINRMLMQIVVARLARSKKRPILAIYRNDAFADHPPAILRSDG